MESNGAERKRPKLLQSIKSMFSVSGPKFVEALGTQLLCPYCQCKFRVPQGLVTPKNMHERAGDSVLKRRKLNTMWISMSSSECKANSNFEHHPKLSSIVPLPLKQEIPDHIAKSSDNSAPCVKVDVKPDQMTRRFTIKEKLEIIDKSEELDNVSATCRWVKRRFSRPTYARKSLTTLLSTESVLRAASGRKNRRKTVRPRTGTFWRMAKELAS